MSDSPNTDVVATYLKSLFQEAYPNSKFVISYDVRHWIIKMLTYDCHNLEGSMIVASFAPPAGQTQSKKWYIYPSEEINLADESSIKEQIIEFGKPFNMGMKK